jgi:NADPH-dependent glutamate synthase beta subunit-like oxidoreductase
MPKAVMIPAPVTTTRAGVRDDDVVGKSMAILRGNNTAMKCARKGTTQKPPFFHLDSRRIEIKLDQ